MPIAGGEGADAWQRVKDAAGRAECCAREGGDRSGDAAGRAEGSARGGDGRDSCTHYTHHLYGGAHRPAQAAVASRPAEALLRRRLGPRWERLPGSGTVTASQRPDPTRPSDVAGAPQPGPRAAGRARHGGRRDRPARPRAPARRRGRSQRCDRPPAPPAKRQRRSSCPWGAEVRLCHTLCERRKE